MPNWVDQELAIVGPAPCIDRFCELAVTGNLRRDHTLEDEPKFLFSKVCPIRRGDRRACTDQHDSGVLLRFVRTDTQAHFDIITAWDLPRHFYQCRLLRDWPELSFCCAVNEDMESFGGIVAGGEGAVAFAVEDYEAGYDRKAHARRARPLLLRWRRIVEGGRSWRVELPFRHRRRAVFKADATFNDLATEFLFATEAQCCRFARRYRGAVVRRKVGRAWRRARPTR